MKLGRYSSTDKASQSWWDVDILLRLNKINFVVYNHKILGKIKRLLNLVFLWWVRNITSWLNIWANKFEKNDSCTQILRYSNNFWSFFFVSALGLALIIYKELCRLVSQARVAIFFFWISDMHTLQIFSIYS